MAYKQELWAEAKKKCRLSEEDIRMAKKLRRVRIKRNNTCFQASEI